MERQAGLGRSLEEVIESLTPAEPDAPHTRGTDLHDITPQLYRLVLDVQDLRVRVDRLEARDAGSARTSNGTERAAAKKPAGKKREKAGGKKSKKH